MGINFSFPNNKTGSQEINNIQKINTINNNRGLVRKDTGIDLVKGQLSK
jgi:hypothetical protein